MRRFFTTASIFLCLLFVTPSLSSAQGFVPCVGIECNTCHLVEMGNTVLIWLIGVLFLVFGVVMAAAGWGLVTSAGNQTALADAKSKFTNAFIGLLIVLAAWLLVDTIMRGLLSTGDGTIDGFGPWSQVECVTPPTTDYLATEIEFGALVTSAASSCDVGPSGERVLCGAQIAACSGTPNVDTSDPSNHVVTCDTPVGIADPSTTSQTCDIGPSGDRVLCGRLEAECSSSGGTSYVDTDNPAQYTVSCAAASPTGACQASEMTRVSLFGFSPTVHNSIAGKLESINADWQSRGGSSFYRVYSVGAYNCRQVTGGSRYSVHAYGLAVDVNPRDNKYVKTSVRPCPSNMPGSFVRLFKSRGFGWGGDWRSVCDAMHFSASRSEGGWMSL
jgi:hypothetical protein